MSDAYTLLRVPYIQISQSSSSSSNMIHLPTAHQSALPVTILCRPPVLHSAACFMQVYVNLQPQALFLKLGNNGAVCCPAVLTSAACSCRCMSTCSLRLSS
jgi:hypothetical protein